MTEEQERYAGVFDGVADAYARERPTYPDELVDQACAGVHTVLEIGCGTGQLTRALVARGLDVDALDPAPNMVAAARERVPEATYHVGRFEDFAPPRRYDAVLSASAFHWVDPRVGWARAGAALKPGGKLALMQNIGLTTPETKASDEAFEAALDEIAPELAPPKARDLATIRRGAPGNVSELWAWVGGKPVGVPEVPFGPPTLTAVPVLREKTADEFEALFRTTAFRVQLGEERAQALEAANRRADRCHGRQPPAGPRRWCSSPPVRSRHGRATLTSECSTSTAQIGPTASSARCATCSPTRRTTRSRPRSSRCPRAGWSAGSRSGCPAALGATPAARTGSAPTSSSRSRAG